MPEGEPRPFVHLEWTAAVVASFLKVWPAKEAPLGMHIAFCDELRRAIEPFTKVSGLDAAWFKRVDEMLEDKLKALRKLVGTAERQAKNTHDRLARLTNQAPPGLRAAIHQAQK
jgi:hypothetical protein